MIKYEKVFVLFRHCVIVRFRLQYRGEEKISKGGNRMNENIDGCFKHEELKPGEIGRAHV